MRIDESHRPWAIASITILAIAVIGFVPYAVFHPAGARGNTLPGLVYGISGYGMMLYAALMGARKKRPVWRLGRAQTWMRGHIWMGALSLPMILLHSAFTARGPLTIVLMTLLVITVLSGITGALLQHFLPKRLTASVPMETIYEQIPEVRGQLCQEADEIVEKMCLAPDSEAAGLHTASGLQAGAVVHAAAAHHGAGSAHAVAEAEHAPDLTDDQRANMRHVYNSSILPYLKNPDSPRSPLASAVKAKSFFEALRRQLPLSVQEPVNDLESICEEERQLTVQRRRYLLLHSWLLVHVPLSITLLVLGGIHAFVAMNY